MEIDNEQILNLVIAFVFGFFSMNILAIYLSKKILLNSSRRLGLEALLSQTVYQVASKEPIEGNVIYKVITRNN